MGKTTLSIIAAAVLAVHSYAADYVAGDGAFIWTSGPVTTSSMGGNTAVGENAQVGNGGQIYAYTDANLDGIDDNTGIAFGFYDSGLGDYGYFYTGGMSAFGSGADTRNFFSTAVGTNASAYGVASNAFGTNAFVGEGAWGGVAVGTNASVTSGGNAYMGIAMGYYSQVSDAGGIAIGGDTVAAYQNSLVIGGNSETSAPGEMRFGYFADFTDYSVGGRSTSAYSPGSVFFGNYAVTPTSVFDFGGRILSNYKITTPVNAGDIATKGYVDTAIAGVGGGGGSMDYTYVDSGDSSTLTAAQTYADQGDAQTLSSAQTYADQGDARTLQSAKDYTDAKIEDIKQELRKEMHESTALALALSSPAVIEPGKENGVSVGVGQYKSAAALGISYSRRTRTNEFLNVGISTVGGNVATRSSYNFSF